MNFTTLFKKKLFWGAFLFLLISLSAIPASAADKNTYLFTVSTTSDAGPGSLRAAVDSANLLVTNPDVKVDRPVVITFDPSVFDGTAGTITLTSGNISIGNHIWIYNSSALADDVIIGGSGVTPVPSEGGIFNIPDIIGSDGYPINVTIENITLAQGKAENGGAIYNKTELKLKGVVFSENEATSTGGGAIYNGGMLTIYDGFFTINKFTGGDDKSKGGGAIYNENGGALYIKEAAGNVTTFIDNKSTNFGGAIWNAGLIDIAATKFEAHSLTGTGTLFASVLYNSSKNTQNVIKDSDFSANTKAVAIHNDNGVLTISHSFFNGNISETTNLVGGGGAIYNDGNASADATVTVLTINDGCVFQNNKAENEGGAIATYSATLNVSDTRFYKNTLTNPSPFGGGAIYVNVGTQNFDGNVNLTNVDFIENSAPSTGDGGAVYFKGQNVVLTVNGGKFEGNSADESGGAIYNYNSTKPMNITGTVFKGNTAGTNGGAIESTSSMTDCEITITNSLFENNKAAGQHGGAIDVANSILVLTNTDFIGNEVGSLAGGTTPGLGGAIMNAGTSITVDGGTFAKNKAYHKSDNTSGQGGAIYNSSTSTMTVQNALFTGNKTTGSSINYGGGAIYTANATSNIAKRDIIVNCIFEENTTEANGGAIFANGTGKNLTIANSIIKKNTAGGKGGGVYLRWNEGAILLNSRVLDNEGAANVDDNISGYSGSVKAKAAYSTFGATLTFVDEITSVTGTNNVANAGTLVAKDASGNVYFADLTNNLWKKADGTAGTPAFNYDASADYGLSGATIYANYIDGTTSRIITNPANAIDVNGAFADAAGNAAPVPGGVILAAFDAAAASVTWSWAPASDDVTVASALTYKVYQSATSPVDVNTATPEATLTGTTTYTSIDLSRPYLAVVVEDDDNVAPLSASYQEAADVIAPIVTAVTPANATLDLAIDGTIEITFSKDIAIVGKVFLNDIELTGTPTLAGATCQIPYSGLAYNTTYTIRIEGFRDAANNVLTTNKENSFTTLTAASAMGDAIKPGVARTYTNSADSIYISGATSGNITITFNEPMSTIYGAVTLDQGVGTLPLAGTWSADSTAYTIRYEGLTSGTEYAISIHDFRDVAGNIMDANNNPDNKFTAGGDDITAPSFSLVGVITPEVGKDKIVLTFNESMDGTDIPASISITPAGLTLYYPGFWSENNTVYTIECNDFVPTQEYTVNFTGFRDASYNALPDVVNFKFIPGAAALPMVLSVSPANNATDVAISGNIVITFNEAMNTTVAGVVTLDNGTTPVTLDAAAAIWAGNAYTISYSALANSETYTIQISGFKNMADDEMLPNNGNSFTTISSAQPPVTITYTLTFDADGGSVSPSAMTVAEGAAAGTLPVPTRADHTFNGWFTGPNASGTQYTASTIVTENITLYAAWTSNDIPTGIEELSNAQKVWSSGGQLYICTPQADKARIYTLTGQLYKQLVLSAKETQNLPLAKGIYIVVFESGFNQKVVVR
ncbi:putative repeat protein (TIGR02543 family) [Parabacteroides sp. PF5-5]|uniref:beta strand repeat-containing protein n=1 Tax=unclassified Parabacteroides TaxID=2649774 RepID=UPI002475F5E7|nr:MULTISPECIES: Ig-like domain-containing protein [unclassified Parabacteroides]MDH6305940.1 putative repeat protein (TIGR02543 family) [Parabacteroides sp. PH5-39]MDH6317196.1 putative repeat protein (TIGR02543 family) [Parabacteroides sp. PF5-13]MDH6320652.1 putative repeat protein (TIGR02543 family) [Parabacteroides sp. PH5-13]MDH6324427.1 putative repeat protein (TIGR02543 family) [Parabacteroides sp. PH5-8]MDH6328381.1 putative repeat protein (TIGR02543 family) [Parabacteroides sp. PH5-4